MIVITIKKKARLVREWLLIMKYESFYNELINKMAKRSEKYKIQELF